MATYPSCISNSQICNNCYASQSCTNCVDGSGSHPCSAFCNSGCNTKCNSCQTFCQLSVENINNHSDVPSYTPTCAVQDEIISKNWTAKYWNDLQTRLKKAATLGLVQTQGSIPSSTPAVQDTNLGTATSHPANSLIDAKKYNEMIAMMNFFRQSLATVNAEDVIKAAMAKRLNDGAAGARFNVAVCDVCNVTGQNRNDCNCSCQCSCGCSCNCTCACQCNCSCSCNCNCSCSCSSGGRS